MARPAPEVLTDIPLAARDCDRGADRGADRAGQDAGVRRHRHREDLDARRGASRAARGRRARCSPERPRAGDPPDAAVVVDDAHLLADDELDQLVELVAEPAATVVVAAEPLRTSPALRALTTAIERENPAVSLGPLPRRR